MRIAGLLVLAGASGLFGQQVTTGPISFEVASIKPTAPSAVGERHPMRFAVSPSGQLTVANMPLHWLIAQAYNLPFQSSRLTGGPAWTHSEMYDIQAVAPGAFAPGISAKDREARTRVMLQALLADRFHLVVRREIKELPAYVIVASKRGVKLKPAEIQEKDCPVNPPDSGIYCHHLTGGIGRGLHGPAVDVGDIANYVENWMDRPVVDQSEIQGLYTVDTEGWSPITPAIPNPNAPTGGENINDPNRPSVFSLFEERFGLKLEPRKANVEMFVIEKAERPGAN